MPGTLSKVEEFAFELYGRLVRQLDISYQASEFKVSSQALTSEGTRYEVQIWSGNPNGTFDMATFVMMDHFPSRHLVASEVTRSGRFGSGQLWLEHFAIVLDELGDPWFIPDGVNPLTVLKLEPKGRLHVVRELDPNHQSPNRIRRKRF